MRGINMTFNKMNKSYLILLVLLTSCATDSLIMDPIAEVERKGGNRDYDAAHTACYRYIYGEKVPMDYQKAFKWCSIAAENMNPHSLTLLAELHYLGNGVPKDRVKSFPLYKAAADKGHMHAQLMLFFHYVKGDGVEKDHSVALQYLNLSAAQGYEKAITERKSYLAWLKENEQKDN
jgi:TPR repeat protein